MRLGLIGPEARTAVGPLIAALKDEDGIVREQAAEARWAASGRTVHAAVPGLIAVP